MSDGPSKLAPKAEPLDDIILGEDELIGPSVSAPPRASQPPLGPRSSNHIRAAAEVDLDLRETQERKPARMTLKIPDDEVSRPHMPAAAPVGPHPHGDGAAMPGRMLPRSFNPDDTLELPSDELRARVAALTGEGAAAVKPATGIDPTHEPGWTPYQPSVGSPGDGVITPSKIVSLDPRESERMRGATRDALDAPLDEDDHTFRGHLPSEEIPVVMDLSGDAPDDVDPSTAQDPVLEAEAPARPPLDSEEIRIDEGERVGFTESLGVTETGEVEIAPEDLMSVEALPAPGTIPPPARVAGKYPAYKDAGTPAPTTASALMAGVAPAAAPSRPQLAHTGNTPSQPPVQGSAVHVGAPSSPAIQISPADPHEAAVDAPAPQMAARRQQTPLVVPPGGGLAPPPMTDNAANRKKTRPWWEELFNDDFIRTMAKVTDGQIGNEVTFIEESLGCEAGAMILDLACGTGRHAVELAARGYQVVGFDLSLAMLARASDEAQDRKQKINFVQGDMREMTFEDTFDGVYAWNTSFGYFDEEKNSAVIARVHKSLKKGGQFLLDVINRDYIVRQAPSLAWFEGDGCICMDEMTIDFITSRMKVKRTLMMDDGRTKEIEYSVRIYALHELGKMLHDNGFRVAEVSGRTGTPGVFFGCESPRTLILAEKR